MTDTEALLSRLTLDEKVRLTSGASLWRTPDIPERDIPVLKVSDGPNGVRGDGGVASMGFPVGTTLASTWDVDLGRLVGAAIGIEAKQKDVQVVLGPTVNIHRSPLGGRNFECYSEDPLLTGEMAAGFVAGLQGEGVGACLKHFVCNDSEFERHTISSEVDERTLREIYLRPFEIAVRKSDPWTVMTAYNRINGTYACAADALVNGVLREQWGFDGLVMSDWGGTRGTVESALGGLDLEMPGPARVFGPALLDAVHSGAVDESTVDEKVRRLLNLLEKTGRLQRPTQRAERGEDLGEVRRVARRVAAEGMVLLRNEGQRLPLQPDAIRRLALIGPNVMQYKSMGGGSSTLLSHPLTSPHDAFAAAFPDAEISVHAGCLAHKYLPAPEQGTLSPDLNLQAQGLRMRLYANEGDDNPVVDRLVSRSTLLFTAPKDSDSVPRYAILEGYFHPQTSGTHEFGLLSTGQARLFIDGDLVVDNWTQTQPGDAFFNRGTTQRTRSVDLVLDRPRPIRIEFRGEQTPMMHNLRFGILPAYSGDLMAEAATAAREADAVVIMAGTSDDWETEGSDRESIHLPGDQDELIAEICRANANTVVVLNTGSPVAMPWLEQADAVVQSGFGGQEATDVLATLLRGDINPSGKLPTTYPRRIEDTPAFTSYPGEFGRVHYAENVFVGYRWYDTRDIDPLFAFGHGLSYTRFDYGEPAARDGRIELTVTNTGERAGREVVQLYVSPSSSPVARPAQELKAFAQATLQAGESAMVQFEITDEMFQYWAAGQGWTVASGEYSIRIGSSSRDIRREVAITRS